MDKVPISGGACLTLGVFCLGSVGTFDSLIGAAYPAVPVVGGTTMVAPGGELIMGLNRLVEESGICSTTAGETRTKDEVEGTADLSGTTGSTSGIDEGSALRGTSGVSPSGNRRICL